MALPHILPLPLLSNVSALRLPKTISLAFVKGVPPLVTDYVSQRICLQFQPCVVFPEPRVQIPFTCVRPSQTLHLVPELDGGESSLLEGMVLVREDLKESQELLPEPSSSELLVCCLPMCAGPSVVEKHEQSGRLRKPVPGPSGGPSVGQ